MPVAIRFCLLLLLASMARATTGGETLASLIHLAWQNNAEIKKLKWQKRKDLFATYTQIKQYDAKYHLGLNPSLQTAGLDSSGHQRQLGLQTGVSRQWLSGLKTTYDWDGQTSTLGFSQPILRGFGRQVAGYDYDQALIQDKLNRWSRQSQQMDILSSIISAYWGLVEADVSWKISLNAYLESKHLYRTYQIKLRMGELPESDLINQQVQVDALLISMKQAKDKIIEAERLLLEQLGNEKNKPSVIAVNLNLTDQYFQLPGLQQVLKLGKQYDLVGQQKKLTLKSLKQAWLKAKDACRPELNLYGNIDQHGHKAVGLNIDVPIQDHLCQQSQLQAKVAYEQALVDYDQYENSWNRQIHSQWLQCGSLLKQQQLLEKKMNQNKKTFYMTQRRFKYGMATISDVVTKQNDYIDDRQQLVILKINYFNAVVQLQKMMGYLLQVWGLEDA
ncbi:TolC family protein [Gammaproteobacteria bacterium]|nr:TolC family protein [Gammaproteobacteria bacterium]